MKTSKMSRIGTCKICKVKSNHLEKHHIIPVSRGGDSSNSNLIEICSDCHAKAHNVSFKSERGGLVLEGIERKKEQYKMSSEWFEKNEDLVHKKLMELYYEDEKKCELITLMLELGMLNITHLYSLTVDRQIKLRTTIKI